MNYPLIERRRDARAPMPLLRLYVALLALVIAWGTLDPRTYYASVAAASGTAGYALALAMALMSVVAVADVLANDWRLPDRLWTMASKKADAQVHGSIPAIAYWRPLALFVFAGVNMGFLFLARQHGPISSMALVFVLQGAMASWIAHVDLCAREKRQREVAAAAGGGGQCDDFHYSQLP